jgi:protein-tyrosine-phosphatase
MTVMNILFVCTGNTCRSPMAEGMMRQLIETEGLAIEVQVKSAGVHASDGSPASKHTEEILLERGIRMNHKAQSIRPELIRWADLILTMTSGHKDVLGRHFPECLDKLFTLKEYTDDPRSWEVSDPFGGSLDVYRATERELEANLKLLLKKITDGDK